MDLTKKVSIPKIVESCKTCKECTTTWCNSTDGVEATEKEDSQAYTPK